MKKNIKSNEEYQRNLKSMDKKFIEEKKKRI